MIDKKLQIKIDALFKDFDKPNSPGCALGIVKDGELIYKKGYGIANLEYDIPITTKSMISIASVSKQFTAMCIALLEEDGKLSLDDNIRKYIPELPDYQHLITIGHLVYMTSGLRGLYMIQQFMNGVHEDDLFTADEAFEIVCKIKDTIFEPGEQFRYCNSGYFLLAQIVKRTSGISLAEFAEKNIFKPLGMKNTFFREDRTEIIKNRAQGYCKYNYSHYTEKLRSKYRKNEDVHCIAANHCELPGAGQVWSTIEDLYLWVNNFYDNKLGKGRKELIDKITTSGKLNDGSNCGYGYGLFLSERKNRRVIFHEGGGIGENTAIYMLHDQKLSVICLANTNYFLTYMYQKLKLKLTELITDFILDDNITTVVESEKINIVGDKKDEFIQLTEEEWLSKIGGFQDPDTATIWKINYIDRKLIVDENGINEFEIIPITTNTFKTFDLKITCRFEHDNDHNISKIYVEKNNCELTFLPFITVPVEQGYLDKYVGEYSCEELNTTFFIYNKNGKLFMQNQDRHKSAMDLYYQPSIRDFFFAHNPPYLNDYYPISFFRNRENQIKGFVFRDYDGDKREVHEFLRQ